MRPRNIVRWLLTPLAVLGLAACGSSKSPAPKGAAATTIAAGSASASSAASPTTTRSKANTTAKPAAGKASASADCPALKSALAGMIVNWQVVAQLPRETDVAKWAEMSKTIGTLPNFGTQLDTLEAGLGSDAGAKKSLDFMKGANDIVQKGLGGDTTASQQLTQYLGTDLTAILTKQTAIGVAMSAAHCA